MNAKTKGTSFLLASLVGPAAVASADLFIYEPFDYLTTAPANDLRFFGDDTQAYDTGLGLGAWSHRDAGGNGTPNGVAPTNEGDIADGGVTFTDSFGNELPVAGNAYERTDRVGQVACSAPIDSAATLGLTADNSTMWMTFLFEDFGFSGPDFGIGLHSEKMVSNDSQSLEAPGYGVGFGITATVNPDRNIHTAVYENSADFTRVNEPTPTFNGPGFSPVYLLAMKVNWNPSGTPDEIFVFIIDDITTEPAEGDALAMDTFDWDLETQQSLDVLNFSDTQVGHVDEIRVATTFAAAVGGEEPQPFAITSIEYDPDENVVTLTWPSRPGESFGVFWSTDFIDWDADINDSIPAADPGESTSTTFDLDDFGIGALADLFFRVVRN